MFSLNQIIPVTAVQVVNLILILFKMAHQHCVNIAADSYILAGDGVHYLGNNAIRLFADVHVLPEFHFVSFEKSRAVVLLLPFRSFSPCFCFRRPYRIFQSVASSRIVRPFSCVGSLP